MQNFNGIISTASSLNGLIILILWALVWHKKHRGIMKEFLESLKMSPQRNYRTLECSSGFCEAILHKISLQEVKSEVKFIVITPFNYHWSISQENLYEINAL